jgi:hypothetical protein
MTRLLPLLAALAMSAGIGARVRPLVDNELRKSS